MTLIKKPAAAVDSHAIIGSAWRAVLVIVASVAVVLELTPWVRAPLATAAVVVTLVFCLRRFDRRSPVDRVLTAVGGFVVSIALLGLLLNVLPSGLTALGWGVGVGAVQLVALGLVAYFRPRAETDRVRLGRPARSGVIWGALAAAVLAGALVWSVSSFTGTHTAPLALSGVPSGNSLNITISSGSSTDAYDLIRSTSTGTTVLASDFEVGPGSTVTLTIAVTSGVREKIELVRTGETTPLRQLILDNRSSTTRVSP